MKSFIFILMVSLVLSCNVYASEKNATSHHESNKCIGAGPQSPRNIDIADGNNSVIFEIAPSIKDMNLCNIHFHRNAEHKSAAYSTYVKDGSHSGWACKAPSAERLAKHDVEYKGCKGIAEGDTIEIHWVHTTCDIKAEGVKPLGDGLKACLTTMCPNPQLKVVAQVFILQKNGDLKFSASPVSPNDPAVLYTGSTTGTSWNNNHCSPLQVTWDVKKTCSTLDIDDFSKWCSNNKYNDNHAHGVRELVTSKALLSKISQ